MQCMRPKFKVRLCRETVQNLKNLDGVVFIITFVQVTVYIRKVANTCTHAMYISVTCDTNTLEQEDEGIYSLARQQQTHRLQTSSYRPESSLSYAEIKKASQNPVRSLNGQPL
ncbi:hypothetical protein DAPPUDRAFT_330152 [Daphnia pulex]|uniref:Uncharacterized protein n=1 Tax=Daphnia pulex TaxID=6669 RepID=E9HIP7_DAPPU|nr:hypothetical protein DAPPUDRAFT_330152 [Daphnia pulex]|eukprot:EFX68402.1 hypothetical protein DAPPUDRAFT_330152 [Daphnia pulex]